MSGIAAVAGALAAICLTTASQKTAVHASRFTLVWQHSVEKIEWEEDYVVAGRWLFLSAARVRGSGAGMEPPPDAVLAGGVWHYRPAQRWFRDIRLARSEYTEDHRLCMDGRCRPLADWIARDGGPTTISACPPADAAAAAASD